MITLVTYLLYSGRIEHLMEYYYTNWLEMVIPTHDDQGGKGEKTVSFASPDEETASATPAEEEVSPGLRHVHAMKLYAINCG